MSERRALLVTIAAIGLLTLALFYRPLILGEAFYELDLGDAYLPVQVQNAQQRADGVLPLWNPYLLYGYPITAEPESGGLYPPALIFNLPLGHERAYGLYIVAHVLLAAFAMRGLAKQLGISTLGQGIAAIVFAFSGAFIAQIVNLPIITTLAWTPLLLALLHRSIVDRALRPALVAGVVLGISLLGSHPQMTLHSLMLCGLVVVMPPGDGAYRERLVRGAGALTAMIVVGLVVAAPQLVHTLAWLGEVETSRATGTGVIETPYEFVTSYSQPPHYLLQHLVPDLFGSPRTYIGAPNWIEQRGYLGLVVLGLVVVGWRAAPRCYRVALVAAVVLSFGHYIGLYHALQHVPLFDMFRCPARFALAATLAGAVIAGFGFDALRTAGERRGRIAVRAYAVAALVLAAIALLFHRVASTPTGSLGRLWADVSLLASEHETLTAPELAAAASAASTSAWVGAAIAVAAAVWWSRTRPGVTGTWTSVVLVALVAFDLGRASIDVHRYAASDFYTARHPRIARELGLDRIYPVPPTQIAPTSSSNLASLDEQHVVAAFLSREPQRLQRFDLRPETMTPAKLAASNVRFWLSADVAHEIAPRLPRAHLVEHPHVIADEDARFAWINSDWFDPWHEVVLPHAPEWPSACAEQPALARAASIVRYEPDRIVLGAHTPRCALLVMSDLYFPGWHATVDGRPAPVLPANGVFRAVALGPGEHVVELRFWPRGMTAALLASALVLLAAFAFAALALVRRLRR